MLIILISNLSKKNKTPDNVKMITDPELIAVALS